MRRTRLLLGMLGWVLMLSGHAAVAEISLSFGLYTSNKPTAMVKKFRPVLDAIEVQMTRSSGEPVQIRIQVAKDYSQGIEHLASGKVDFSRFGPASYIEAKQVNAGLRILAMEREQGEKVFYGIICVAKNSPIQSITDLRGKSFAFGNDQSTIGRYLSQQYLLNHDVYSADLSRYDYLERHDKVGTSVGAGHFDAGALNEATFDKLVGDGVPIREIARFPNVTKPWIAREGLPARLFDVLRDALLSLEDPEILSQLKKDGFVRGDDEDFADIRAAIEHNHAFFDKPETDASVSASPEEAATEALAEAPDRAPASSSAAPSEHMPTSIATWGAAANSTSDPTPAYDAGTALSR